MSTTDGMSTPGGGSTPAASPAPLVDWGGDFPLPGWVNTTTLQLSESKRKRWASVSLTEALGFVVDTPCKECVRRGTECKVRVTSLKLKCSRCDNMNHPCSLNDAPSRASLIADHNEMERSFVARMLQDKELADAAAIKAVEDAAEEYARGEADLYAIAAAQEEAKA